jgi:hypothetical protein
MLTVVKHEIGDRQGIVVIEGTGMEEVGGTEARNLALKTAAAQGLSRPGISGTATPYPVDADGESSQELIMGQGKVAGYRVDYPVTGGL